MPTTTAVPGIALPGFASPGDPGLPSPVVTAGSGAYAVASSAAIPLPGIQSLQVTVGHTPGNWMVAVIAWRDVPGYPVPSFTVADDGHNWWDPASAGVSISSSSGNVRCSVWIAPAARACTYVMIAPSGYTTAFAATIYDLSGMLPWVGAAATSTFANASTSLTVNLGVPAGQAYVITVAAADNLADTVTQTGTGWSAVTTASASNGVDHTADIACLSAFQGPTFASTTATWSSSGSQNLAGVSVSLLTAAPASAQASPYWPVTWFELAPGSGFQTLPDAITWQKINFAALSLDITQGRQYETATLATGEGTMLLDNPTGTFLPPGSGPAAGIDAGTPVRLRQAWLGGSWQVQFSGSGGIANPGIDSGNIFTVTAGQSYSTAMWLGSGPGGMTVSINWKTAGGVLISSTTSSPVTASPQLVTVTGTAPATATQASVSVTALGIPPSSTAFYAAASPYPAVNTYLVIPATVTWTAVSSASVTTLAQWKPDIKGPPNPSPWYIPFSGYVERLPQTWDAQLKRGEVQATVTDVWFSANANPQPILVTEVLNDQPHDYWPCSDPAGSKLASNLSPRSTTGLYVITSKYGVGTTTNSFGNSSPTPILGAQTTTTVNQAFRLTNQSALWQQVIQSAGYSQLDGYCLQAVSNVFPSLTGGVSVECWFQTSGTQPTGYAQAIMGVGTARGLIWYLTISNPGFILQGNNANLTFIGSTNYSGNPGPLTHVVMNFSKTAWTLYVNGVQAATGSLVSGAFGGVPSNFAYLDIGGSPQAFIAGVGSLMNAFAGFIGHVAVYPFMLSASRISTHYQAGILALDGENAEARVERLLEAGNVTGRRVILQPSSMFASPVVSASDIVGQPVSQSVSNVTSNLLPGVLSVAPTGDIFLLGRQYAYNQPAKWVLGEDSYLGEYAYEGDISFDYDPTKVVNQIQITQLDNQDVITSTVPAVAAASQAQYGTITLQATGYLEGDATAALNAGPGLYDYANWLQDAYGKPLLRLGAVSSNAASNPRRWPFFLGVAPGDIVTVNRRPQGAGSTPLVSVTGRVTQTARSLRFSQNGISATVKCMIDFAPELNALMTDSVTFGTLNGVNRLPW